MNEQKNLPIDSANILVILVSGNHIVSTNYYASQHLKLDENKSSKFSQNLITTALTHILNKKSAKKESFSFQEKSLVSPYSNFITWEISLCDEDYEENRNFFLFGSASRGERQILDKKVKRLEAEMQTILKSAPGKLYWKDINSFYVGANKEWLELVGLDSLSKVIGKRDEFFFGENKAKTLRENDRQVMETGETIVKEESVELASGETRYFIATKMPRYDEKNKVIGIIGNSIDITKQKQLEKELISSRAREERFRAMSSIGGMIAHELRTPLMSIGLNAETLANRMPMLLKAFPGYSKNGKIKGIPLNRLKEIPIHIEEAAKYCTNTISTILKGFHHAVSKNVATKKIDLGSLIQDAISTYPLSNLEKTLIKTHFEKNCVVTGAPDIVTYVTHNLLKNSLYAIQAARKGKITISVSKESDHVLLLFKDTAKGVSEEILAHMFDPYFTTKDNETSIGLGLYFCRLILEKTQGNITCQSKEGVHTTFYIKFKTV